MKQIVRSAALAAVLLASPSFHAPSLAETPAPECGSEFACAVDAYLAAPSDKSAAITAKELLTYTAFHEGRGAAFDALVAELDAAEMAVYGNADWRSWHAPLAHLWLRGGNDAVFAAATDVAVSVLGGADTEKGAKLRSRTPESVAQFLFMAGRADEARAVLDAAVAAGADLDVDGLMGDKFHRRAYQATPAQVEQWIAGGVAEGMDGLNPAGRFAVLGYLAVTGDARFAEAAAAQFGPGSAPDTRGIIILAVGGDVEAASAMLEAFAADRKAEGGTIWSLANGVTHAAIWRQDPAFDAMALRAVELAKEIDPAPPAADASFDARDRQGLEIKAMYLRGR